MDQLTLAEEFDDGLSGVKLEPSMNARYSLMVHMGPARRLWKFKRKAKYWSGEGIHSTFCSRWSLFSSDAGRPLPARRSLSHAHACDVTSSCHMTVTCMSITYMLGALTIMQSKGH